MYELFGQGLEGVYSVLSDCNFKGVREDQDGMIRWGGEVRGGRSGWIGVIGSLFLIQVAYMVGRRGADCASCRSAGRISCTSLCFLMRGFRRKVDESILVERSSRIHLEVVLYIRQED